MLNIPRKDSAVVYALVAALNAALRDTVVVGTRFHSDQLRKDPGGSFLAPVAGAAVTIDAPNATDLATSVVLVNQIKRIYNQHRADGTYVHKAADGTNIVTSADATDLASGITLGNEIKADYEAHRASATFHFTADATNTIAAVNASDQSSLNTLLNELKTDINAHMAGAPAGHLIQLMAA